MRKIMRNISVEGFRHYRSRNVLDIFSRTKFKDGQKVLFALDFLGLLGIFHRYRSR